MKKRYLDNPEDDSFTINLSDIPESNMSVADYKDMVIRNRAYLEYVRKSGLTDKAWCYAMNMSLGRHRAYVECTVQVPNVTLNNAERVTRKIQHSIDYCRKAIIDAKLHEL